ncbi:MAG: flagellar motor switch protein FliG [Paracoccaceae bacterium]
MSSALPAPIEQTAAARPGPPRLTGRQKAAIIVRVILADGGDLSLIKLSDAAQTELIYQMAELRHVDHPTMLRVIREFVDKFDGAGLSFPGALDGALSLLDGSISAKTASRIRKTAGLNRHADPWARISGMGGEALLPVMERESIEVGAVILSKLKVSTAAQLLGLMPGERARRITYAVSLTGEISPAVVLQIGHSVAEQLDAQPERAFDDGPVERVGAILNFSLSATREDVLDGLEQADSGFAKEVRKAIFTFANIPDRIDPRDVPKITREVDGVKLVTALAAATGDDEKVTEFILSNMSQRMADQLREEMEEAGDISEVDGEAAMTEVVIAIRELEASGDIFLVAEDE